ncbi:L-serine ammonia-lyase [Maritalea mediterranea]|uniref:L-serine dehydratase n=1 Tax=Maritalea mediterranea TaxID=2909667 RepID=A0ABS9EEB7_9HYPH|nr:L-serine ammonia-lyase [Maritalea mediterranea]MCF4099753.1 L-serine ammonia-lyase [Maritalea mediterranea]
MFVSVFDVFKVSIGPSSSHTMGPMVAAKQFLEHLVKNKGRFDRGDRCHIECQLQGSLAFTGKGHATDQAVLFGLLGFSPETFDRAEAEDKLELLRIGKEIEPTSGLKIGLEAENAIVFDYDTQDLAHPNSMVLSLKDEAGEVRYSQTYLSIGGGFVMTADEYEASEQLPVTDVVSVPYPFKNANQMLEMGKKSGKSIIEMKRANELSHMSETDLELGLKKLWQVMDNCIERGLGSDGTLPGGLKVRRRAAGVRRKLLDERGTNLQMPHAVNDWISLYAMAVNEENAAGGQVVTSPTNGAAGVFPAVTKYYLDHVPGATQKKVYDMLLAGAAIGGLIKHNASISGAEVGCQGEVGSASAMAAAALCAVLGGTNEQIENASEIALEHHLGMTCDPVNGLVQVPCIERNGLGAIKAVAAASLALNGDGTHVISLDACIKTMYETGKDMDNRYKETSLGGLSVNYTAC